MKCQARLVYYKAVNKEGRKRRYCSVPVTFGMSIENAVPEKIRELIDWESVEVCGGNIEARISCHEEPGYGEDYNTWAELDVDFVCKKCGQTLHNLPSGEHELNNWLTKIIESI